MISGCYIELLFVLEIVVCLTMYCLEVIDEGRSEYPILFLWAVVFSVKFVLDASVFIYHYDVRCKRIVLFLVYWQLTSKF